MKTVEVDVYVVVGLHHESRLAAEGGDPHVAHHRFVCQVSVHSSSGSAISKSKALLVGVFKVALDDVHVNCTFSFQLKYCLLFSTPLTFVRHKKKRSPLPVLICFLAFPP